MTPDPASLTTVSNPEVLVFDAFDDALPYWDSRRLTRDIFLQPEYLKTVEDFPPSGMTFRYAVIRVDGVTRGIVYCQLLAFNGADSIRYHRQSPQPRCFFQTFGQFLKGLVARKVSFRTVVAGNLMLTGHHGYAMDAPRGKESLWLESALQAVRDRGKAEKDHASITLIKDFEEGTGPDRTTMSQKRYHPFRILPSLILTLSQEWRTMGDYLNDLSSKYRVRANKARQLFEAKLHRRDFTEEEVRTHADELHRLYQRVVDDSGFNVIHLHPKYIAGMSGKLGPRFLLRSYWAGDQLVGFISAIVNTNGELEAHFLGYREEWNPPCKLYLNMLLDLVELGIRHRCHRIIFARTADEIKSSVGAVPVDLTCYIRHRSPFSNQFIRPILDYLTPEETPVLRHPFRHDQPEVQRKIPVA